MNRSYHLLVALVLATSSLFLSHSTEASQKKEQYFVKYRTHMNIGKVRSALRKHSAFAPQYFQELGIAVIQPNSGNEFSIDSLEELSKDPQVEYVEKVFEVHLDPREKASAIPASAFAVQTSIPSDPLFSQQPEMTAINAPLAWETATGSKNIVVAVIDTGVDYFHPDLQTQMWVNPNEIPGNNKDDDDNGHIDDVHGWSFVNKNALPVDEHGHGTHVSGTIGAATNNGVGVAGMNWNVSIMALQALDKKGSGNGIDSIAAILYAASNGARIINASWGGRIYARALEDAIVYAKDRGVLFVAAAGNNGENSDEKPHFPSAIMQPNVVSVGASYSGSGQLTNFSNFGTRAVHLAAPGYSVLSTWPSNRWNRLSGTSMATPMVAGVAALMLTVDPKLSYVQLRNGLMNATVPASGYVGRLASEGDLKADKALAQINSTFQVWPNRIRIVKGSRFQFTAYGTEKPITWSVSQSQIASISSTGLLNAKELGSLEVKAVDADGKEAFASDIRIVDGIAEPPTGCASVQNSQANFRSASVINFALPFVFAFLVRTGFRRRRNGARF